MSPGTMGYTTATWEPVIAVYATAARVPIEFAVQWEGEESGGNPCAIGKPGAKGPDGNPREMGIAQLYNPDDLRDFGVTGDELRAYCVPGTQTVSRPLTEAEVQQQASLLVRKISKSRSEASHYMTLAGARWPSDGVDFWRLVKLVHGLPGLVHGLVTVAHHLGRAPSWSEFRRVIEAGEVTLDAATEGYRAEFGRAFDNAEKCTSTMRGEALS